MKKRRSVRASRNKSDFSNRAVIIMLVLLVVVSILSIGFYLNALDKTKPRFVVNEGKASGEVLITITKAPEKAIVGTAESDSSTPSNNLNNPLS